MAKENKARKFSAVTIILVVVFCLLAFLIIVPLYALLLGTFKGGAELFVSGLNLNPSPTRTAAPPSSPNIP